MAHVPTSATQLGCRGTGLARNVAKRCGCLNGVNTPHVSHVFFSQRTMRPAVFVRPCSFFFIQPSRFGFAGDGIPCAGLACGGTNGGVGKRRHFGSCFSIGIGGQLTFNFGVSCLCKHKCCGRSDASCFGTTPFVDCVKRGCRKALLCDCGCLGGGRGKNVAGSSCVGSPRNTTRNKEICRSAGVPAIVGATASHGASDCMFLARHCGLKFRHSLPRRRGSALPPRRRFIPIADFVRAVRIR